MRTLDTVWSDLFKGYRATQEAQRRLERSWRSPVEKVRRLGYTQELKEWERRLETAVPEVALERKRYLRRLAHWRIQHENFARSQVEWRYFNERYLREKNKLTWAWIIGLPLAVLFFISMIGIPIGLFLLYWIFRQRRSVINARGVCPPKPQIPVKPQEPDFSSEIGPKPLLANHPTFSFTIEAEWWQNLRIEDWSEKNFGTIGVHILLETLERGLPDDVLAFREIPVQQGLDVDLLIIAPSGLWLFECKHLSGQVVCDNGNWYQLKEFYLPGGIKEKKTLPFDEPPDEQWLREVKNTSDTLYRRLPYLSWLVDHIHGGIVFTHESGQLQIDDSCKVKWGTPGDWLVLIRDAKPLSGLTLEMQLKTADALIKFANRINNEWGSRSSLDLVQQHVSRVETRVKKFTGAVVTR